MTKRLVLGALSLGLLILVVWRIVQATRGAPPALDVGDLRAQLGIPVEIAAAAEGPLVVRREFTGVLRGIREATVRAKTGDEIVEIPVRVGQRVRAGEVVIRQSGRGSLASVDQAEAAHQQATRSVERLRPLKDRGAISDQDWDNALTGLRVAEANLEAARRSVDLISPIDGIVTDIPVTRGMIPESGDPLVRVSDLSRVQVLLEVSPEQARELALAQPALLVSQGLEGRVTRIALQASAVSRLLEVELTFPGPGAGGSGASNDSSPSAEPAIPGTLVTARVEVGRRASALLVPRAAVREGIAWMVGTDGCAHRREVTLGLAGDGVVEVLSGLAPGERVVVAGASLLSDGARIRIVGGPSS
ncbi:MAG TPA: efflux RND transporter periplasmic adaptor subunit [Gemmatimonadales bacterium]|jgi:RND family efflux transporter MFP subunit|nr:efflux RND transporter periplasmic adaptor subunit [Gemmatimonadales bacterium]